MNKKMKKIFSVLVMCIICAPVVAADVSDRTDCTTLRSRISELTALESPDESQSAELAQLQAKYRADCSKSAAGRRTTTASRVSAASVIATPTPAAVETTSTVETVVVTVKSVLNEYLGKRQDLCAELKSDIDMMLNNDASDAEIAPLQNQYDADCTEIDKSESVVVDAETAARNVSSGLCEDGSKPNQFGCCTGETFTDMGNLVFACCPDDGGTCYPPINSGNAL